MIFLVIELVTFDLMFSRNIWGRFVLILERCSILDLVVFANMVHRSTFGHNTLTKNFEQNSILEFKVYKLRVHLGVFDEFFVDFE